MRQALRVKLAERQTESEKERNDLQLKHKKRTKYKKLDREIDKYK